MTMNEITFPALLTSNDGWMRLLETGQAISNWNYLGINNYKNRPLYVLDSIDRLWRVKQIVPEKPLTWLRLLLARTVYNPRVRVTLKVEEMNTKDRAKFIAAIRKCVKVDDDVVKQWSSEKAILNALKGKSRFKEIVSALKEKRAI